MRIFKNMLYLSPVQIVADSVSNFNINDMADMMSSKIIESLLDSKVFCRDLSTHTNRFVAAESSPWDSFHKTRLN